ncbi:MAG: PIN domain-containing protein [Betaproteobacteria bacterium]|nr:PIN domain-containing protein [Betaproteobacteria bacterium]
MKRITADTNLFIHAADPDSPHHSRARNFFDDVSAGRDDSEFVLCELVLVELYMQLRNAVIFSKPYSARESAAYCLALKQNPKWRCVDYDNAVASKLWHWASTTKAGFRRIIDARLGLTLRFHGVNQFATVNTKDFQEFGFQRVWNPLSGAS